MGPLAKPLLAVAFLAALGSAQNSGTGTTTRYWDCCKPSCAWNDLAMLGINSATISCDINDNPLASTSIQSGCVSGGTAYMCSNQTPWAVSATLAYGFAAVASGAEECCQCYQLDFTSTAIAGKTMIVQATNTGGDVGATQFDIAMPGGGFGIFDGCTNEWGATPAVWGAQFGGPSTDTCPQFPTKLQAGCEFRWNWYQGADNPTVNWSKVACPNAIVAKSGCVRTGDVPVGPSSVATFTSGTATATVPVASTLSTKVSTAPVTTATASSGNCATGVAQFAQCGGQGYTGSTTCACGFTCQVLNPFFFQCLS